jgi:hypothetical protein
MMLGLRVRSGAITEYGIFPQYVEPLRLRKLISSACSCFLPVSANADSATHAPLRLAPDVTYLNVLRPEVF